MALKLKGSTSGFVGLDAPAVAGNNTLILPENSGSAFQLFANDITAGVTTFTSVTVNRNGDLTVPGTISIGGTLTYEDVTSVDSVGIVTARQGIFVDDSITHLGDTNTKIRFPGNDTFTVETGGSERVRVNDIGMGVGITPVKALNVVVGSGTTELIRLSQTVDASVQQEFGIGWCSNNNHDHPGAKITSQEYDVSDTRRSLVFYTRGTNQDIAPTERMRINEGGNMGLGTNNPTHKLHIQDATTPRLVVEDTTNNVQAQIGADNTDARIGTVSNHPVSFRVNDSTKLTIDTSGRLLINGTDANTVHTNADDVIIGNTSASLMGLSIVTGTSGYATLQFSDGGGAKNQGQIAYNHSNDSLILTANSESIMTIQSNGVVKVEKSDSSSFQAHFLVNNSESNSGISLIGSGSSFNEGGWAAVTDAGIIRSSANSSNGLVLQAASGDMRFYVAGSPTERMRITSGGALQFDSGYGEIKTAYGCRAWVDIDNTSGNMTLSGGGNVSSVTDLGGGAGRVNFSSNMIDTTYAVVSSLRRAGTYDMVNVGFANASSNFRYDSFNNGSSGNVDLQGYAFAVFR